MAAADHDDDAGDGGRFSSPDPLTDDLEPVLPSSTRRLPPFPKSNNTITSSITRGRSTAPRPRLRPAPNQLPPYPRLQDFSDFSLPYNGGSTPPVQSSAMTSRSSRRPSPRKRTFELDVGDGQSPQRIYVTVEAEEQAQAQAAHAAAVGTASKRGTKRKLFPPSSPTRPVIHGEEITTTSVPLRGLTDDEGTGGSGGGDYGDENENMETPRKKRGRPRKSNGTPMPTTTTTTTTVKTASGSRGAATTTTGRKRAPTPAQKKKTQTATSTQRRRNTRNNDVDDDDDIPGSAASRTTDASMMAGLEAMDIEDADADADADATPRAKPAAKKPRIRKTPAKPAAAASAKKAAIPSSSQAPSTSKASGTGRKRGRPRKALMPDELAPLTESEMERSTVDASQQHTRAEPEPEPELPTSDAPLPSAQVSTGARIRGEVDPGSFQPNSEDLLMLNSTPTPSNIDNTREMGSTRRQSRGSRVASPQLPTSEGDGYADEDEGDDMQFMTEQPSDDMDSDFERADGVTYGRQDTLAHASDFSMIAVESLPSFQASFQGDMSRMPSEGAYQSEMGEETNMIINQTLESLRRSTQTDAEGEGEAEREAEAETSRKSPDPLTADDDHYGEQSQSERTRRSSEIPAEGNNSRAWSRSPSGSARKPKPMSLSRQLFSSRNGKAPHVDDSFSTLPDSLLQAATPRHLPMKQTTIGSAQGDTSLYEDEFSEIPDEILEAATPKPPSRITNAIDHDAIASENAIEQSFSASRSGRLNFPSDRLPTPDDTSSSNNGSKRAQEEEQPVIKEPEPQEGEESNSHGGGDIPSSPPDHTQSHVIDFGASHMHMQREASGTPGLQRSSPQLPPSGGGVAAPPLDRVQSLEPPAHIGRPSLSPIVRVARTLQSVISDRSSPEGRESNLGSPFRSSVSNEPHRQSSVARSPLSHSQSHTHTDSTAHSHHAPSSFNPISSFTQRLRSSQNRAQRAELSPGGVVGEVEDPFGPDMHDYTQNELLRRSAYDGNFHGTEMQARQRESGSSVPPSDDQMSWAANNSPEVQRHNYHEPTPQQRRMRSSSFLAANASSTGVSRVMDALAVGADGGAEDMERAEDFADDESEPEHLHWQQQQPRGASEEPEEAASRMDEQFHEQDDNNEDDGSLGPDDDDDEDDMDIWDIEASRATPDEPSSFIAHVVPKPKGEPEAVTAEPPRRSKITSPWRRSSRRLIYKDEVMSPSQIEIEEGAVSEVDDEFEMVPPASRRTSAVRQRQSLSQIREQDSQEPDRERELSEVREETAEQQQPEAQQQDVKAQEDEYDEEEGDDYDLLGQPSDGDSIAEEEKGEPEPELQGPESDGYSMVAPTNNKQHSSPARSIRDDEYSLMAPSDQLEAEADAEAAQQETSLHTNTEVEEYSLVAQQQRNRKNVVARNNDKPVVQQQQQQQDQGSAKRKSGFFGGFDILSFFSSPAALPKTRAGETPKQGAADNTRTTSNAARVAGNNNANNTNNTNTTSTFWSNGLFPSVPRQDVRPSPSPERTIDFFLPDSASEPRSTDARAEADDEDEHEHEGEHDDGYGDDYEDDEDHGHDNYYNNQELSPSVSTPSRSPSPQQPTYQDQDHDSTPPRSVSAAPSTPERSSNYPPIEQKRNFTPRPRDRQSPAPPSLFAPRTAAQFASETSLEPNLSSNLDITNNSNSVDFLEVPQLQLQREREYQQRDQEQDQDFGQEDMDMESSVLTDGTDYERVPPRAKPSQWDRTLSPSKSCFRSPLKPTTPGRVVAFSNENTTSTNNNNNMPSFSSLLRNSASNGNGNGNASSSNAVSPAKVTTRSGKENNSGVLESTTNDSSNNESSASASSSSSSALYPSLPVSRWDQKPSRDINNTAPPASSPTIAQQQQQPPPLSRDMNSFGPTTEKLSPTTWTRSHWLRLDALATLRRRNPAQFRALCFPALLFLQNLNLNPNNPDKNTNPVDEVFEKHRLRGKEVAAQGAAILLEGWHLEVVEAFRAEVGSEGGWDDVVIAKRLFALLVGEVRRAERRRGEREMMRIGVTAGR